MPGRDELSGADPAPIAEWFAHMASVPADSEREVEMHFTSPLFREGLGYREDQEAAGFAIRWAKGSTPGHVPYDNVSRAGRIRTGDLRDPNAAR